MFGSLEASGEGLWSLLGRSWGLLERSYLPYLPLPLLSELGPRSRRQLRARVHHPFSLPNFVQIPPFPWLPFLPLPWAVLGSSWAPKSSQVGPKLPPEAPLLRKLRFPKKRAPPCMGTRFWGPGPLRTSSRRLRELFKTILTGVLFQPHF